MLTVQDPGATAQTSGVTSDGEAAISKPEKHAAPSLFRLRSPFKEIALGSAAAVLLYVTVLAQFSLASFPTAMQYSARVPYLMDKPVGEDGFYMLTVADNIAMTGHIIYNRGLPATGIQPLATAVFSALDVAVKHFHGDNLDLIRWVMLSGAVLLVVFARQMASLSASLVPDYLQNTVFFLAFVLVLFDFTLFRLFTYGLETGLYLCFFAICFRVVLRIQRAGAASTWNCVCLGLAAGLAGEARIDFGFVFALLLAVLAWRRLLSISQVLGVGALAILLVSPWFWFIHSVTGSWMPTSGKAESTLITSATAVYRLRKMLDVTAGHVAPWSYGSMWSVSTLFAYASCIGLAWLLLSSVGRRSRLVAPLAFESAILWSPALLGLLGVYVVFFNSTHFYYRYASPAVILIIPLIATLMANTAWIRRHLALVSVAIVSSFAVWSFGALHEGRLANSQAVAAGYIHQNFPDAHVGSFQSGVVGYFNRNVENLDGKLNLAAWQAAQQKRLPEFLDREQVNVLVDWPSIITYNLPRSYLQEHWQKCPVPLIGTESICLVRKR